MSFMRNWFSCVGKRPAGIHRRATKVRFDFQIVDTFKTDNIPSQIKDLLVYIAREGVAVTDLFRRPGNPKDMKKIIQQLKDGSPINWTEYNFYTLANVAKKFLISIDQGIMGPEGEAQMLATLELPDDQSRIEALHRVILSMKTPVRQLLALLFGTWFRMIYHTEVNAMSVEAVAKSVAGSVFHSCVTSPEKVERASKVMEYLITGFASAELFGQDLIEYFTTETKTSISRVEKFKYEFAYPQDVTREQAVRLFIRMLLEESERHGFDILKHEVSREVFDATSTGPRSVNRQHSNVQQTSEKRTCVKAEDTKLIGGDVIDDLSEDDSSLIDAQIHTPDKRGVSRLEGGCTQSNKPPSLRFNSIRRRQMERLQMRSDWFLSPPTGCQSSSLMQLNPEAGLDLTASGPDLLESHEGSGRLEDGDGDSVFFRSGELTPQPSSEPALRRRQPSPRDKQESETRYFVVDRYYGPDPRPPSSPLFYPGEET